MTQKDGTGKGGEGSSVWGTRVYLWLIHVDVWQNEYNIVIKLQLKNKFIFKNFLKKC